MSYDLLDIFFTSAMIRCLHVYTALMSIYFLKTLKSVGLSSQILTSRECLPESINITECETCVQRERENTIHFNGCLCQVFVCMTGQRESEIRAASQRSAHIKPKTNITSKDLHFIYKNVCTCKNYISKKLLSCSYCFF